MISKKKLEINKTLNFLSIKNGIQIQTKILLQKLFNPQIQILYLKVPGKKNSIN